MAHRRRPGARRCLRGGARGPSVGMGLLLAGVVARFGLEVISERELGLPLSRWILGDVVFLAPHPARGPPHFSSLYLSGWSSGWTLKGIPWGCPLQAKIQHITGEGVRW